MKYKRQHESIECKVYTTKIATNQYNIRYFMMDCPWSRDQEIKRSASPSARRLGVYI